MNKKKLLALAPGCLIAMLFGSNVCADTCPSGFYIGFDVLKTNYSTKAGYGRNVFAKNPTAFNAFVGYKLPRNFFVEAGYEWTGTKGRSVDEIDIGSLPGMFNTNLGHIDVVQTKIKTESPYVGVGISHDIDCFKSVTISGLIGLSATKLKAELNAPANDLNLSFAKRKISPILKANLNYSISKALDVRFTAVWHNLTNFKIKTMEVPETPIELRMKNGYTLGVGLVYSFQ